MKKSTKLSNVDFCIMKVNLELEMRLILEEVKLVNLQKERQ